MRISSELLLGIALIVVLVNSCSSSADDDWLKRIERERRRAEPLVCETLQRAADAETNTIIVVVGNGGFAREVHSFVCNLFAIQIPHYVVVALDRQLYEYCVRHRLQVMPSWLLRGETDPQHNQSSSFHYGTIQYNELTHAKSRIVYRILKLGYNVLLCDADIALFRDPRPYLHSLAHNAGLLIQNGAPMFEKNPNIRELNSGFYLAVSNAVVARLFSVLVHAAKHTEVSEQPVFNSLICRGASNLVEHSDLWCDHRFAAHRTDDEGGLRVLILDRDRFPNGSIEPLFWQTTPRTLRESLRKYIPKAYLLHNNYVVGEQVKWERFESVGLTCLDVDTGKCRVHRAMLDALGSGISIHDGVHLI